MQEHGSHLKSLFEELVLLVAAVGAVAYDRVKDVRHVLAQLVHTTRGRSELNQGIAGGSMLAKRYGYFGTFQGFEAGEGLLQYSVFPPQRIVYLQHVWRMSAYNGQVLLVYFALGKEYLHGRVKLFIQRKKEYTPRLAVQPVDRMDPLPQLVAE